MTKVLGWAMMVAIWSFLLGAAIWSGGWIAVAAIAAGLALAALVCLSMVLILK